MKKLTTLIGLCTLFAALTGCLALDTTRATIVPINANSTPEGTQPALVWTIDGKRVSQYRDWHRVEPGRHTVSVLPKQDGPRSKTLAYAASAPARGIEIAELEVDLKPGQTLQIAAVVRRHRIYSTTGGTTEALTPWQTTVLPYSIEKD